ncbi:flagellar hook assembly protein FlgD [Permianibacter sp. IMCC34836]|uniref:flagellar hook assembly protein FlgD n=1 Tax=Permianibacter fluminis TaxID=2738515 RepID=UPI001556F36A|nr:flagellar hook assembly protein FlgD [Permianibacter fluminis]NQD38070.1 flagellar hook assembly protein FlgD [Permianibacter fluminis]
MTVSSATDIYSGLGLTRTQSTENDKKQLGQEDFLALLTTQLQYQDPFKPLENTEFIAQMAQFSSLDSQQQLLTSVNDLASSLTSNQALQASSMVGRTVLVPNDTAYLFSDGGMSGTTNLSANAYRVQMQVTDENGQLVYSEEMGPKAAGKIDLWWNGQDASGNRLPAGKYKVSVFASVGNRTEQLAVQTRALVTSVNMSSSTGGIVLNLAGLGSVPLSDVKEIGG